MQGGKERPATDFFLKIIFARAKTLVHCGCCRVIFLSGGLLLPLERVPLVLQWQHPPLHKCRVGRGVDGWTKMFMLRFALSLSLPQSFRVACNVLVSTNLFPLLYLILARPVSSGMAPPQPSNSKNVKSRTKRSKSMSSKVNPDKEWSLVPLVDDTVSKGWGC